MLRSISTSSPPGLAAVLGNSLGTIAVLAVAVLTFGRRPLANALIVGGVAVSAAGSGLSGLGVAGTSAFITGGALLLYLGFVQAGRTGARERLDVRREAV